MCECAECEQNEMTRLEFELLNGAYVLSKEYPLRLGRLQNTETFGVLEIHTRELSRWSYTEEKRGVTDWKGLTNWFLLSNSERDDAHQLWTAKIKDAKQDGVPWWKRWLLGIFDTDLPPEMKHASEVHFYTNRLIDAGCRMLSRSLGRANVEIERQERCA